jgi:type I restriction enzyme S subunit
MPVIGVKNVQDRFELDDVLYLSGLSPRDVERARISSDWTVIVGSNGNRDRIGNAQLIRSDSGFLFASFLIGAKPKPDSRLRPDYFFRWLSSEQVQAYLSASAEGTTGLSNLSHSFFKNMSISIPPPEEQAAIVRILDAVDTALERTRDAVEQAQVLQQSVLEEAFCDLVAEPRRLGEFATEVRYGTSRASNDQERGNAVLRIPNVVGDRLSLDDLAHVDLPPSEVERLRLHDGDLLLVRTNGNPSYVGRSAVFHQPDTQVWVYASYLIRVRMRDALLPDYVNIFLGLERGRRELLRRVTTSAGNHNINSSSIRSTRLPVPVSHDAQKEIVELAKGFRSLVDNLRRKIEALGILKRSLMHDLLTGDVRVADATEAPGT